MNTSPRFALSPPDGSANLQLYDPKTTWHAPLGLFRLPDGGFLLAGRIDTYASLNYFEAFLAARYSSDGVLDTGYGNGGWSDIGLPGPSLWGPFAAAAGSDGRLVAMAHGQGLPDVTYVGRFAADGRRDTAFDGDGLAAISGIRGRALALQSDGKVVVAYATSSSLDGLARLTAAGGLDTGFGTDGLRTLPELQSSLDLWRVAALPDGRLLLFGVRPGNDGIAVARLRADLTPDPAFGIGGVATVAAPSGTGIVDFAIQPDGRILVAASTQEEFASGLATPRLVRLRSDGAPDTSFDGDGVWPGSAEAGFGSITGLALQPDGGIVVNVGDRDGAWLVRLRADGSTESVLPSPASDPGRGTFAGTLLADTGGDVVVASVELVWSLPRIRLVRADEDAQPDPRFGAAPTMDGTATFVTGGPAVVLDANVRVVDAELGAAASYAGATLAIARSGGARAADRFEAAGGIATLAEGSPLVVDGVAIGTVAHNSGGTLGLAFGAGATQALVDRALQSIAYRHAEGVLWGSEQVTLQWTFSDGNTGAQGPGGALAATGSSRVALVPETAVPSFAPRDGFVVDADRAAISALALTADGRLLAAGASSDGADTDIVLTRHLRDGQVDTAFADGGRLRVAIAGPQDAPVAVLVQADGRVVLVATTRAAGQADFIALRLNPDGSADTGFGTGGIAVVGRPAIDDVAEAAVLDAQGRLLIAGTSGASDGTVLARLATDGRPDTGFDGDGVVASPRHGTAERAAGLALQTDGRIVVAGSTTGAGDEDFLVLRFLADGRVDTAFDGDGAAVVSPGPGADRAAAIAVDSAGRILVAGTSEGLAAAADSVTVAAIRGSGALDAAFGTAGFGRLSDRVGADLAIEAMALDTSGHLLLAGQRSLGSAGDTVVMRLSSFGFDFPIGYPYASVTSVSPGTDGARSMLLQPDGRIVVGAAIEPADGTAAGAAALLRLNPQGALDLGFGTPGPVTVGHVARYEQDGPPVPLDPDARAYDAALATNAGYARFSGEPTPVAPVPTDQLGGSYRLASLVIERAGGADPDDRFGASGLLEGLYASQTLVYGGLRAGYVETNADGRLVVRFEVPYDFGAGSPVSQRLLEGVLGSVAYANVAPAPPASVTLQWSLVDRSNATPSGGGELVATATSQVAITPANAAPSFAAPGTAPLPAPFALAGLAVDTVAIAVQADGATLVLGTSQGAAGRDLVVARLMPDGTLDTAFGTGGAALVDFGSRADAASAIAVQADGRIVVAGTTLTGSHADFAVARLDTDGRADAGFGSGGRAIVDLGGGAGSYDRAQAMVLQTDGRIVVGGTTGEYPTLRSGFLRLTTDGRPDTGFDGDGRLVLTSPNWANDFLNPTDGVVLGGLALDSAGGILFAAERSRPEMSVGRLLPGGALDTAFGVGGVASATPGASNTRSWGLAVGEDGRITAVGWTRLSFNDFDSVAVARWRADGTPDTGFDGDGLAVHPFTVGDDRGRALLLEPGGGVLVGGASDGASSRALVPLARLRADGSLDTGFGTGGQARDQVLAFPDAVLGLAWGPHGLLAATAGPGDGRLSVLSVDADGTVRAERATGSSSLDGVAGYAGQSVVLDPSVQVVDPELSRSGSYDGAYLVLARAGGADPGDRFTGSGALGPLLEGGPLVIDGVAVGTVAANAGGSLRIEFGPAATQERVNAVLGAIAFASASLAPLQSALIEWVFGDAPAGEPGAAVARGTTRVDGLPDTTPPDAPTILRAFDDQPPLVGALAAGATTNDPTPRVEGLAEPGARVELWRGASRLAETTADALGAWALTTPFLGTGTSALTARAIDAAGNAGPASAPFALSVSFAQTGTVGGDWLQGTPYDDALDAGPGDDTLVGAGGDDSLTGGPGIDAADWAGPRAAFDVVVDAVDARGADGSVSSRAGGPDLGDDRFFGLERLRFDDAILAFDTLPGGRTFDAAALLSAWGLASPGAGELGAWTAQRDAAGDAAQAAQALISAYGGEPDDAGFLVRVHTAVLGVAPDDATLAGLLPLLESGAFTQATLLAAAAALPQNVARFAPALAGGATLARATDGTAAAERLDGTEASDWLRGLAGDDTIAGLAGDDLVDGGDGVDAVLVAGARANAAVVRDGAVVRVTSPAGVDVLVDVERIVFDDRALAIDTRPGEHGFEALAVLRLWFGRAPSGTEFARWLQERDAVAAPTELAANLLAGLAPGISNAQLVSRLYEHLVGTPPTAAQTDQLASLIDGGAFTQAGLLALAADMPLNTQRLVDLVGTAIELG